MRGNSNHARTHFCKDAGEISTNRNVGSCFKSALVNAIRCMRGLVTANEAKVKLEKNLAQFRNLKPLSIDAHQSQNIQISFSSSRSSHKEKLKRKYDKA